MPPVLALASPLLPFSVNKSWGMLAPICTLQCYIAKVNHPAQNFFNYIFTNWMVSQNIMECEKYTTLQL